MVHRKHLFPQFLQFGQQVWKHPDLHIYNVNMQMNRFDNLIRLMIIH